MCCRSLCRRNRPSRSRSRRRRALRVCCVRSIVLRARQLPQARRGGLAFRPRRPAVGAYRGEGRGEEPEEGGGGTGVGAGGGAAQGSRGQGGGDTRGGDR